LENAQHLPPKKVSSFSFGGTLLQKSKMSDEKLFLGKFAHVEGFHLQSSQISFVEKPRKTKKNKIYHQKLIQR